MSIRRSFLPLFILLVLMSGCLAGARPDKESATHPSQPAQPAKTEPGQPTYRMYLIALEDDGKSGPAVGCGDSLVAVDLPVRDVKSALSQLLENHDQLYGQSGLYNALYRSDLLVHRIERTESAINADLMGNLVLGGECDYPRVKAQLEATLIQSAEIKIPVTIRVNGDLLDDLLSGK